jgi:WD40 repeat protein
MIMKALRHILLVVHGLTVVFIASPSPVAFGREWTDDTGGFHVEAELVTVRGGKAYLEKPDGTTIGVPLPRLCGNDLRYLMSLEEYREYFRTHPIAGSSATDADPSAGGPVKPPTNIFPDEEEPESGEIRRFKDLGVNICSLAFSPDGRLLALGRIEEAIEVLDVRVSKRIAEARKLRHLDEVTHLVFTPDGRRLISGGESGVIQEWNVDALGGLTESLRMEGHRDDIMAMAVSRDGRFLLSSGRNRLLKGWDLTDGRELFSVGGFRRRMLATLVTDEGRQGLACNGEFLLRLDMKTGEVLQTAKPNRYGIESAAFSPDGTRLAVSDGTRVYVWGVSDGKQDPVYEDREVQWCVAFIPGNRYLLSGGTGTVTLWDTTTHRRMIEFDVDGGGAVKVMAIAPDGRHFAAVSLVSRDLQVFRLPASVVDGP